MSNRKIYVVAGTPGVGKSTVLQKFKEKKSNFIVINFGDVMFEIGKKRYNLNNRDELRTLVRDDFRQLQSTVIRKLAMIESNFIINTHASVKTSDGYYPGLPRYVLEQLPIESFIYIHAPLEEIIDRRRKDKSRKRDVEKIEDLKEHDEINRSYLVSYSMFCNSPVKYILNSDGKLNECVEELCNLVKIGEK